MRTRWMLNREGLRFPFLGDSTNILALEKAGEVSLHLN